MKVRMALLAAGTLAVAWACGQGGADADAGTDDGLDTESEPGTDADADADADTDTGPDPCSNSNLIPPFVPEDCPEQEPTEGCVRFVDVDSAAEEPDGLSWDTAFRTVQAGIDSARCGAIVNGQCEVWVAKGRYHVYTFSRRETIQLRPGVGVYGGFAGGETALEQRDWEQNETILDGREAGDGPCHALHVVTGSDDAVLDGFTVTGGRAWWFSEIENSEDGGGMLNVDASPTVRNCAFVANEALKRGGGMRYLRGSPVIRDCLFEDNVSKGRGGGVSFEDSSQGQGHPLVSGCTFVGNIADASAGGAIHSHSTSATIEDSEFFANEAQETSAITASCHSGGGCAITIEDCTFVENKSKNDNSAVQVMDHAFPSDSSDILIRNCEFHDNFGGGFASLYAEPIVENCVFIGNQGLYDGAIYNSWSAARLVNCTISGNSAALPEGAGGVFSENSEVPCGQECPEIINSIVWGNGPVEVKDTAGANTSVSHSDIGGGWPGFGNIDADPLFVNAPGYDFRLLGGSPCIDAANGVAAPDLDFDGQERWDDPDVPNSGLGPPWADMGAFENVSHQGLRSLGRAGTRRSDGRHWRGRLGTGSEGLGDQRAMRIWVCVKYQM